MSPSEQAQVVINILNIVSSWSDVLDFIHEEGYNKPVNPNAEKRNETTLADTDTFIICAFLYLLSKGCFGDKDFFNLGELAEKIALNDPDNQSPIKSARLKVRVILERVGDVYGLIDYSQEKINGRNTLKIKASKKLIKFFEQKLIPKHSSLSKISFT